MNTSTTPIEVVGHCWVGTILPRACVVITSLFASVRSCSFCSLYSWAIPVRPDTILSPPLPPSLSRRPSCPMRPPDRLGAVRRSFGRPRYPGFPGRGSGVPDREQRPQPVVRQAPAGAFFERVYCTSVGVSSLHRLCGAAGRRCVWCGAS